MLLRHLTRMARSLASERAANISAARIPMMAMTTKSSISVKPIFNFELLILNFITSPPESGGSKGSAGDHVLELSPARAAIEHPQIVAARNPAVEMRAA